MVASVKFTPEGSASLSGKSIPVTSVQKGSDGSLFVWTIDKDSTVHRQKVTLGSTRGNYISVVDGINLGQRIVTEGYQKLSDGSKVIF